MVVFTGKYSLALLFASVAIHMSDMVYVDAPLSCTGVSSWNKAYNCCDSARWSLPRGETLSDNTRLRTSLKVRNMTDTWLMIQRKRFNMWTWMNGLTYKGIRMGTTKHSCGGYNPREKSIYGEDCSSANMGHICEKPDCVGCSTLGYFSTSCTKVNSSCYIILYENGNWFNSRSFCIQNGWKLAIINNSRSFTLPSDLSVENVNFWIGLRREDWMFSGNVDEYMSISLWGLNQPTNEGDCVTFSIIDKGHEWRATKCSHTITFLCESAADTTLLPTTTSTPLQYSTPYVHTDPVDLTLILCVSIGGFVVCFSIILLIVCILKRKRMLRKDNRATRSTENIKLGRVGRTATASEQGVISEGQTTLLYQPQAPPRTALRRLQGIMADSILERFSTIDLWAWHDDNISRSIDEIYTDLLLLKPSRIPSGGKAVTTHYSNLISKSNRKITFLQGAAGTGKTTLCKKILVDWANLYKGSWWTRFVRTRRNIRRGFRNIKMVLPIFLRDFSADEDAADIIMRPLNPKDLEKETLRWVIFKMKDVLLICDGLDEYRRGMSSEIDNILEMPTGNLLITSRLFPSGHLIDFPGIRSVSYDFFILKGFSIDAVKKYIDNYFGKGEASDSLKREVESKSDRRELSQLPFVLLMMCILWKEDKILLNTITGFYTHFLKYVCGRYEKKYLLLSERSKQAHILTAYEKELAEIGWIAADTLTADKLALIFPIDNTDKMSVKAHDLGFLQQDHETSKAVFLKFPHKTVHEFFVAYFIINCNHEQRYELFQKISDAPDAIKETDMVVTFVKELGGENIIIDIIKGFTGIQIDKAKTSTEIILAYLINAKEWACKLPSLIHLEVKEYYTPEVLHRYFSMDCSSVEEIIFGTKHIRLLQLIQNIEAPNLKSITVYSTTNSVTYDGADPLRKQSAVPFALQRISVNHFDSLHVDDVEILVKTIGGMYSVKHINLSHTKGISKNMIPSLIHKQSEILMENCRLNEQTICCLISETMKNHMDRLEILDLSGNLADFHTMELLGQKLKDCTSLREIRYPMCLHDGSILAATKHLYMLREIVVLDLSGNAPSPDVHDILNIAGTGNSVPRAFYNTFYKVIVKLEKLRELRLCECRDIDAVGPVLAILKFLGELRILDLSGNITGKESMTVLGNNLPYIQKLEVLRLCTCVEIDSIEPIVENIKCLPHLRVLDISGNKAKQAKARVFSEHLNDENLVHARIISILGEQFQYLFNLEKLYVCSCEDQEAMSYIVNQISCLSKLTVLDISHCVSYYTYLDVLSEVLQRFPMLKELRLCFCEEINSLIPLFKNLPKMTQLTILDMSGAMRMQGTTIWNKYNSLNNKGFINLAQNLEMLEKLEEVRLCGCKSDNRGEGNVIISSLRKLKSLKILSVGPLSLTEKGIMDLSLTLESLPDIRQLLLTNCDIIDQEGSSELESDNLIRSSWTTCCSMLHMVPLLQALDLSYNQIGDCGVLSMSKGVSGLVHLHSLALVSCGLSDIQTTEQLINNLPPGIRLLYLSKNFLGSQIIELVVVSTLSNLYEIGVNQRNMSVEECCMSSERIRGVFPNILVMESQDVHYYNVP